uniref:Uncharacterized protein n=1 Tax=Meloidogyne enterolobii TaxID=390850 RepID=A0A6V7W976_MELEN|nr:unnamed protein product [Meloidogyne enterolobii]
MLVVPAGVVRPALGLMCLELFGQLCFGGCWYLECVEEATTDQWRTSSKNPDEQQ